MSVAEDTRNVWRRFEVSQIEELQNAVLGAELDATQMSEPGVSGSLAFAATGGVVLSSGLIRGKVALRGVLAPDAITLFLILRAGVGARVSLGEAGDGDMALVPEACDLDVLLGDGSLYVAATLTRQRLREAAAGQGVALDPETATIAAMSAGPVPQADRERLIAGLSNIHRGVSMPGAAEEALCAEILRLMIARLPGAEGPRLGDQARIISEARDWLLDHVPDPISTDDLARRVGISQTALERAFLEILGEGPQDYLTRLRLHWLRRALFLGAGGRPVAEVARACGLRDDDRPGVSERYKRLFGERLDAARAAGRAQRRAGRPF